jgi:excinuclease ABC subunit C
MSLRDQAKQFPLTPGVYTYKDKDGVILYVGRATSLRRRVLQYFRKDIDPRIGEMVSLAETVTYRPTDTVLETIILEANMIKEYWPKYNILDKDHKSFIFLVIPKTDFPKPIIVRGRELKNFPVPEDRVFGPYPSYTALRTVLKIVRRIFPYSTCQSISGVPAGKACFDYQIGLCPGVCIGAISKQDYQKNISNILLLLRGEKTKLVKKLSKENPEAALHLKHIQDVSLISREDLDVSGHFNRIEGYDISHFAGKEVYGSMVVFTSGEPDNSQYRLFKIKTATNNDLEALKEMLERRLNHTEWPLPDLILIDGGKPQIEYLASTMERFRVKAPWLGLSKLYGDHLVFPAGTKNVFKELAETIKRTLQQVRDEAHRFANRGRSRRYFNDNLGNRNSS